MALRPFWVPILVEFGVLVELVLVELITWGMSNTLDRYKGRRRLMPWLDKLKIMRETSGFGTPLSGTLCGWFGSAGPGSSRRDGEGFAVSC